ncbi:cutinase-domain-containing protein [Sordaria brevicollis]|uniref:cutinase n=1 Tax=Sordaria brevicollis TaxID=83679 RepID=A0AAE0PD78_SORBR|nr:cutinase-domain-containing protein [Sordaria brevicollis]
MKSFVALSLAALALANPLPVPNEPAILNERQTQTTITATEFTRLGCRPVIFLFARGSTEVGNMGTIVGPPTSNGIKAAQGVTNVVTEGIDYPALLSTNFLPGGADLGGIREMKRLLNKAATDCPNSKIVVAGYSQGAALVHRAVEDMSEAVKDKIVAAVTYGDTQRLQDRGRIPNFPESKTLIICNTGDLVCLGQLTILAPHLDYERRVPEALAFINARLAA